MKHVSILLPLFVLAASAFPNEPSFFQQDRLLGDILHPQSLEDLGLTWELIYTGEVFENIDGGIDEGGQYRGDISIFAKFDTEQAGLWNDGLFFLHLQHQHGRGITEEYLGDFQVLSNIDADDFNQVSEFWYQHSFLDERLLVTLGKIEFNGFFAFIDYGLEFIHSSPGFSPTIPLTTYPDPDWGAIVGIAPVDWFSMNVGISNSPPDGGRSIGNTIDQLDGPMLMAEPAFHYDIQGMPGSARIGGWWNGAEFDHFDSNPAASPTVDESYGLYFTLDQAVWREADSDEQGLNVFAQYGWSPEDRTEANHYYGGGVEWKGAIPTRDDDIAGLGVFHVEFSDDAGFVDDGETAFELFYKYQLFGWMTLKPDLQYIINPGGAGLDDALAVGVRWEVVF